LIVTFDPDTTYTARSRRLELNARHVELSPSDSVSLMQSKNLRPDQVFASRHSWEGHGLHSAVAADAIYAPFSAREAVALDLDPHVSPSVRSSWGDVGLDWSLIER
jgi:hypothetical protein